MLYLTKGIGICLLIQNVLIVFSYFCVSITTVIKKNEKGTSSDSIRFQFVTEFDNIHNHQHSSRCSISDNPDMDTESWKNQLTSEQQEKVCTST